MRTLGAALKPTMLLVPVVAICILCPSFVYPQSVPGTSGAGVGRPGAGGENSRWPIQVKLEGFLHFMPAASQRPELDVVTLGITRYGDTYPFVLVAIEAVDLPRITQRQLLKTVKKWQVNFDIVGPKDLLSEVAQALPGTPLTIVGYLTPRKRRFQLSRVEGFGFDMPGSEQQAELLLEKEPASPPVEESAEDGQDERNELEELFPLD